MTGDGMQNRKVVLMVSQMVIDGAGTATGDVVQNQRKVWCRKVMIVNKNGVGVHVVYCGNVQIKEER